MAEIRRLQKLDKVKLTLSDDSVILLPADLVAEVSQDTGEVHNIHNICGIHPIFGPSYCLDCKAKGNLDGCGKWFVVHSYRGEPGPITILLKDGGVLYPHTFELIEDDGITFIKPDGPKSEMKYV